MSVSPSSLALAVRCHGIRINERTAAMFLGYWLEHGIVEQVTPNRYRLTDYGYELGHGLLDLDTEPLVEEAA